MAKIVISTVGTLGDFLPFRALGRALQARGHDVVLAVNPALVGLARAANLTALPCGPPFGPDEARRPPVLPVGATGPAAEYKKFEALLRDAPHRFRDLAAACRGADLLVAHSYQYAAMLVHDQLRLPWVCVALSPGQFVHPYGLPTAQPAPRADLNLLASSPVFGEPNPNFHDYLTVTGFWFEEECDQPGWQPTPAQRAFVEDGDRPLVLCLGGTPAPDAATVVRLHADAAATLGRKLVVQAGWADLRGLAWPETGVLVTDFVAHDWLFAHAETVIHPGGIGTTARALRHGCPMLLEPSRKDQLFHAALVRRLDVGYAMDPRKLSAAGVAQLVAGWLATPAMRQRAEQYAARLRAENGLVIACGMIESLLRERRPV